MKIVLTPIEAALRRVVAEARLPPDVELRLCDLHTRAPDPAPSPAPRLPITEWRPQLNADHRGCWLGRLEVRLFFLRSLGARVLERAEYAHAPDPYNDGVGGSAPTAGRR